MDNTFISDFLANFLSDFLVGVIFGTILALGVGIVLSKFGLSQQRKVEKKADIEKALRYLELLKNEITHLLQQLPNLIGSSQPIAGPEKIRIPTPFWGVLQPSGELPRFIEPKLVASLTKFYDELMYAKQGNEWLLTRLVNSDVTKIHSLTQNEIEDVIKVGIEQGLQAGMDLPSKIDAEIKNLREQMEALE